ncbi:aminotransferase-like domain-containing protein [Anaerosporobacter faecicola]|uniref:aminotransferase-like domain-containing protein n=1 Tax=Anaerosporobacter faecicola TaxID=2718714 RepID=UPI00143BDDDD|nr:PLP-dependent aminotransferase family protein [Anaerosporobacter faecicola]
MLFHDLILNQEKPIYEQIMEHIQYAIQNNLVTPDSKLPSTRELAHVLGVSRNTVIQAYENLEAENMIQTKKGRGTFITGNAFLQRKPEIQKEPDWRVDWNSKANTYALQAEKMDIIKNEIPWSKDLISFKSISPDGELFDLEEFKRSFLYRLSVEGNKILNYGYARGYLPLIEYLKEYMAEKGVSGEQKDILITNGFTEGFEMMVEAFTNPGDYVLCENPTHNTALRIMHLHGVKVIGVPMGKDGLNVDEMERLLQRYPIRFIYVIPSYHNPTGIVIGEKKRTKIYECCRFHGVPIIEDGFTEELLYGSSHVMPIASFDRVGNGVIYIGSFSKILFPGLRIGWIMGDKRVISLLESVKRCKNIHTSSIDQGILYEYLQSNALERQMKRMRKSYKERFEWAKDCVEEYMDPDYIWGDGGLHLYVGLKKVPARKLLKACYEKKVIFMPGDVFSLDQSGDQALRLGLSRVTIEEIAKGISIIGECQQKLL